MKRFSQEVREGDSSDKAGPAPAAAAATARSAAEARVLAKKRLIRETSAESVPWR